MSGELESLDGVEVDLTPVDFAVSIATVPCYDVEILRPDVSIEFKTLAGSGPPGADGAPGPPGAAGANGKSAYTNLTASFTVPAAGGSVIVQVADTSWAVVGENVWVQDAGGPGTGATMRIIGISSTTLSLQNSP